MIKNIHILVITLMVSANVSAWVGYGPCTIDDLKFDEHPQFLNEECEELKVDATELNDEEFKKLVDEIPKMEKLNELEISFWNDDRVGRLMKMLSDSRKKLRKLDLSGGGISNIGAIHIAEALANGANIGILDISINSRIDRDGAKRISDVLTASSLIILTVDHSIGELFIVFNDNPRKKNNKGMEINVFTER